MGSQGIIYSETLLNTRVRQFVSFFLAANLSCVGELQVNSLIDRGQLWRLATSSVLHANPMHLMVSFSSTIQPFYVWR